MAVFNVYQAGVDGAISSIPISFDNTYARSYRVQPGPIAVQILLTGGTLISLDFAFANESVETLAAGTDTNWYLMADAAATIINTTKNFGPGRFYTDLSAFAPSADATHYWNGCVPNGANWMRIRLQRTGSPTALSVKVMANAPYVS